MNEMRAHTTEFHCGICRIKQNMELKHEQLVYEKWVNCF